MAESQEPYGYVVDSGYMGYVEREHKWMLFETEEAYEEYISE